MKILIIGNMGYIGPVLVKYLRSNYPEIHISAYDSGFFSSSLVGAELLPEFAVNQQYFGDVRDIADDVFKGMDAVIYLAAISNDPMGQRFEVVTDQINHNSALLAARKAADAGVGSFVFASSCSVYGAAEDGRPRAETDPLNPLTAYARSKIDTEFDLAKLDSGKMLIRCLRFATACGFSPRLRLDLVLNDFVACALSSKTISVLSDGSPWRPLIDVNDMSRAMDWAAFHSSGADPYLTVNVGSSVWNWQIKQLAEAVAEAIPGTEVHINTDAPPDKRSYRVDFSKFEKLAPDHQPRFTLQQTIAELRDGLMKIGFADADFRNSDLIRLHKLERLIGNGILTADLYYS